MHVCCVASSVGPVHGPLHAAGTWRAAVAPVPGVLGLLAKPDTGGCAAFMGFMYDASFVYDASCAPCQALCVCVRVPVRGAAVNCGASQTALNPALLGWENGGAASGLPCQWNTGGNDHAGVTWLLACPLHRNAACRVCMHPHSNCCYLQVPVTYRSSGAVNVVSLFIPDNHPLTSASSFSMSVYGFGLA